MPSASRRAGLRRPGCDAHVVGVIYCISIRFVPAANGPQHPGGRGRRGCVGAFASSERNLTRRRRSSSSATKTIAEALPYLYDGRGRDRHDPRHFTATSCVETDRRTVMGQGGLIVLDGSLRPRAPPKPPWPPWRPSSPPMRRAPRAAVKLTCRAAVPTFREAAALQYRRGLRARGERLHSLIIMQLLVIGTPWRPRVEREGRVGRARGRLGAPAFAGYGPGLRRRPFGVFWIGFVFLPRPAARGNLAGAIAFGTIYSITIASFGLRWRVDGRTRGAAVVAARRSRSSSFGLRVPADRSARRCAISPSFQHAGIRGFTR